MRRPDDHTVSAVTPVITTPPSWLARGASLLVIGFMILVGLWSYHSAVDVVVSAHGEVVPTGMAKRVQAAESGVVRAIHVHDGQHVEQGELLLELDDTASMAEHRRLESLLARKQMVARLLRGELGETGPNDDGASFDTTLSDAERHRLQADRTAFEERLTELRSTAAHADAAVDVAKRQVERAELEIDHQQRRLEDKRVQAERGLVPRQEVVDAGYVLASLVKDLEVLRERIREARSRASAAREAVNVAISERRGRLLGELVDTEAELETLAKDMVGLQELMNRQRIRAPVSGTLQELSVNTVGGVVARAEQLMTLVPDDAGMELNARIPTRDIGFVRDASGVRVKFDAFEFTRYGTIAGELQWVGGDSIPDEHSGPVYPARIALSSTTLPNQVQGREARISPGMQATVDIVIGERRLYEYLLEPLLRYRDESMRER